MADEVPAPVAEIVVPAVPEAQDGAENAPPADPNPAEKPAEVKPVETEEDRERKRKGYLERNLTKAIRREAEAKARADILERQVAELRPKAPVDAGSPKLENFSDIEEYATAKAEYAKQQDRNEREANHRSETQKREVESLTSAWEEKADRAADKYDDFQQVVGDIQPTMPFTAAIMRAKNGEDVAYHLGKHPEEARAIIALHPMEQFLAIGALSAKLQAEPPKVAKPSSAPAPIKPVGGSAVTQKDIGDQNLSDAEFNKIRRSQIAQRA